MRLYNSILEKLNIGRTAAAEAPDANQSAVSVPDNLKHQI
jgi:hypothetical protein